MYCSIVIGIKNDKGRYIISLPSRSRTVYYEGARIEYKKDSITVDGPIKSPLTVVVSISFLSFLGVKLVTARCVGVRQILLDRL